MLSTSPLAILSRGQSAQETEPATPEQTLTSSLIVLSSLV